MIIVKLIGGLGNQMFQYAFFLSILKRGISAKIDISDFDNYSLHNGFELFKIFGIKKEEQFTNEEEVATLKDLRIFFKIRKLAGKILCGNINRFIKGSHKQERNYSGYYPEIYFKDNSYLEGYWQNEKYFKDIRPEILNIFTWKNVSKKNQELAKKMQNENSVSIHIRRLDKPRSLKELFFRLKLNIVWRTCPKSYYINAINRMDKLIYNPEYYIFTNNIRWARKNIKSGNNLTLVDWNRGKKSNQDLYLMSRCRHNIISMSSFSWWGAWLNRNPDKIVIAPKKWAVRFTKNLGIIPKDWINV